MARVVKAKLGEDLRRINVEFGVERGFNMTQLSSMLSALYGVPTNKVLKVRYVDEDGDFITITSDIELQEAVETSTGALRLELELVNPEELTKTDIPTSTPTTTSNSTPITSDDESIPTSSSSSSSSSSAANSDEEGFQQSSQEQTQEEPPAFEPNGIEREVLPTYDPQGAQIPKPEKAEGHLEDSPNLPDIDYLANEFHYHRLIMATAFQDSFDKIKSQYNQEYRPRVNSFFEDVQTQTSSLLTAIEKTLDSLKEDFEKSTTAQEASKKFSDGLREIGMVTEPVMEKVRRSFQNLVSRLFETKQPITITAPEIIREMETFSSPPTEETTTPTNTEATSSETRQLASTSTSSANTTSTSSSTSSSDSNATLTPSTNTSTDLKVASQLSSDFIYLQDEAFKFEDQLRHIQSMGFSNDSAIKTALLIHNGDINTALDSLMMAE